MWTSSQRWWFSLSVSLSKQQLVLLRLSSGVWALSFSLERFAESWTGRFVTGLGVGSLSMAVPLYNAEIAPPEVRGSLVALQQLAITFGIMVSFWIDYGGLTTIRRGTWTTSDIPILGTNYIGGTGEHQHEAAWRIPLALQLVPAIILGVGILFMPFSPRWAGSSWFSPAQLYIRFQMAGKPRTKWRSPYDIE